MATLPVDLESKLAASDGGPSYAVARIVFRERIDGDPRIAELASRLTPTELDVILARMAHTAHIDHSEAAYHAFETEFSYVEPMLELRTRPVLQGLDSASETSPSATESVAPEL
jgi:hypothetical protein